MAAPGADLADLRDSFAAATFPDGGLLVHLPSGNFFQLDERRAVVWAALLGAGALDAATTQVAAEASVPPSAARALVEGVIAQAKTLDAQPPADIPRFEEDARHVLLRDGAAPVLSFDKQTLVLAAGEALRSADDETVAAAVRIFAPKIFARWFRLSLHASAISVRGKVILFSGASGAGKTTTARRLSRQSGQDGVIGEDVVMLAESDGALAVVGGAEAVIQSWLHAAMETLVSRRSEGVPLEPVQRALGALDHRLSLGKMIFLDRSRRGGTEWSFAPLSRPAALAAVFQNSFLYSSEATALRSHLAACRALAAQISAVEAVTIPDGLAALESAARLQIETIAS